jgi:hypothetical protein
MIKVANGLASDDIIAILCRFNTSASPLHDVLSAAVIKPPFTKFHPNRSLTVLAEQNFLFFE